MRGWRRPTEAGGAVTELPIESCTKEHPNPHAPGYLHDDKEITKDFPGYWQWWCRNCGLQVTEAGWGVNDK
jgi:hypothetical protein